MKTRVEIDTHTFVRFWLVLVGFVLALVALYSAWTGLVVVGAGFFMAVTLYGPVNALASRVPGRSRALATAIAFILIIVAIGTILVLAVPPMLQQTSKLLDTLPGALRSLSESSHVINDLVQRYHIEAQVQSALASMQANLTHWAAQFGANIVSSLSSFASFVSALFLSLVMAFLMLVEGPMWMRRIWSLYQDPAKLKRHQKLGRQMQAVVANYVTGQLAVSGIGALIAGAAAYIISLIFPDVPGNLALPTIAITFVLSLIPMFGATLAGATVALLIGIGSVPAAIAYVIFFIIYQQIENNFVSPAIQSKQNDLSPLEVLIAVTLGIYVFGLAGGIISIPIAGSAKVLLQDYLAHRHPKTSTSVAGRLASKLKRSA